MNSQDEREDLITGINVIPLVDVFLVLLIVFMVTASIILSPSIRMELPKANMTEPSPLTSLTISLTAGSDLLLNGKPITEEKLLMAFEQAVQEDPIPHVIISADQGIKHGEVIHLIDMARTLGLSRFALMVEKKRP